MGSQGSGNVDNFIKVVRIRLFLNYLILNKAAAKFMCYVIVPYQSIDRAVNQIVTNEAMIHHIYLCNLSLTRHTAEKETGEGATEHAPGNQIITGKFVLGGGFCSVFSEPLGWGGWAECHPCSHMSYW